MSRLYISIWLLLFSSAVTATGVEVFLAMKIGTTTMGAILATTAITTAISIGISFISRALMDKPTPNFNAEAQGRSQIVRSSVAPRRVIYGRIKTSGVLVFATTAGDRNKYLHMIIVLAGHRVAAIDEVYFNDRPATDWPRKWWHIEKHLGGANQAANRTLQNAAGHLWTAEHRLRGCAYLYVRLTHDPGSADTEYSKLAWPNGIPNVQAIVRGKKVFDPRTDKTVYSTNWALCIADYLKDKHGLNSANDEINWDTIRAAANICDERVRIATTGKTQPRYTCNGSYTLDSAPLDILESMRAAGAGAVFWTGGEWQVYAGAPVPVSHRLNEDDLRGDLTYQARADRGNLFNAVRGTFVDPDQKWQPTDFPIVKNDRYLQEDGNEQLYLDLDLPFVTNNIAAQRLAKIELERHRQAISVSMPCNLNILGVKAWDVVAISIKHLGWTDKKFQVVSWALSQDFGIDLELIEYSDTVYTWALGDQQRFDPAPNTDLIELKTPNPANLVLSADIVLSSSGEVVSLLDANWESPPGAVISGYEVQYKLSLRPTWLDWGKTAGPHIRIVPVIDNHQYDVRVRAVSSLGIASNWTSAYNFLAVGKSAPPSQVGYFKVDVLDDGTRRFSWTTVDDVDVTGYRIKYFRGVATPEFETMQNLHEGLLTASPWETLLLDAGSYVIAIVAVDSSGNESPATFIKSNITRSREQGDTILMQRPLDPLFSERKSFPGFVYEPENARLVGIDGNAYGEDWNSRWRRWLDAKHWGGRGYWLDDTRTRRGGKYSCLQIAFDSEIGGYFEFSAEVLGGILKEVDVSFFPVNGINKSVILTASDSFRSDFLKFKSFSYSMTFESDGSDILIVNDIKFRLKGDVQTAIINDANTASWGGSAAAGRRIPTTLTTITQIQIALQSVGAGWTWEVINKSPPTIKIYDSNNRPRDATVDVYLRGVGPQAVAA